MTTIRRFSYTAKILSDRAGIDAVFRATRTALHHAFKPEPTATIASLVYCHMYAVTVPQSCFILENGAGEVVGYVLGTPHTPEFVYRFKYCTGWMLKTLGQLGIMAPPNYRALKMAEPHPAEDFAAHLLHTAVSRPSVLFGSGIPKLWEKWPAQFQMSILPEFQKQGWGRALMEAFLGMLVEMKCQGVHAAVAAGNVEVEGFFKALGFERYPGVMDGGDSGEEGRTGGLLP